MIKTFIFVEDGSVDLDELKNSVGDDVLVVTYRQGATPPAIQQPREPVSRREVNIKDRLLDLMIEFDEMGFSPTTVCEEPEGYAIKWKELLLEEIKALESDNVSLRNEADENASLSMENKMRADRLEKKNVALRERLEKAVELPFYPDDYHIELDLARIIVSTRNQSCTIAIPVYVYINCDDENSAEARLTELKGGTQ